MRQEGMGAWEVLVRGRYISLVDSRGACLLDPQAPTPQYVHVRTRGMLTSIETRQDRRGWSGTKRHAIYTSWSDFLGQECGEPGGCALASH